MLGETVAHRLGYGVHGGANVDRGEVERHHSGIDRGEIEDVVDDGEQRRARGGDVAEVLALLPGERAGRRILEQLCEADDVGQRRAQFIRDQVHEVVLEIVGGLQRLVAFAQRALDID